MDARDRIPKQQAALQERKLRNPYTYYMLVRSLGMQDYFSLAAAIRGPRGPWRRGRRGRRAWRWSSPESRGVAISRRAVRIAGHVEGPGGRAGWRPAGLASSDPLMPGMTRSVSSKWMGRALLLGQGQRLVSIGRPPGRCTRGGPAGPGPGSGRWAGPRPAGWSRFPGGRRYLAGSSVAGGQPWAGDRRQVDSVGGALAGLGMEEKRAPPLCSTIPYTVDKPRPVPLPGSLVVKEARTRDPSPRGSCPGRCRRPRAAHERRAAGQGQAALRPCRP